MKSALQMASEAYQLLIASSIKTSINGGIYLMKRPQNSIVQDIVINTLALTNNQLQAGVFNINIHVPNITVQLNGKSDNTQPDLLTLGTISDLVGVIFQDYVGLDFRMYIDQPGNPIKDDDGTWYINLRINYLCFQPNYSNI